MCRVFNRPVRKVIGQSSWMVAGMISSVALGVLQMALVTRSLGPEKYGLFVLVSNTAMIVHQLLSLRVWEWGTVQFAPAYVRHDREAAATVFSAGLLLSLGVNLLSLAMLAVLSPWFATEYLQSQVSIWLLLVFGLTLVANWPYDLCYTMLRLAEQYRYLAGFSLASAALRCALLGGLALVFANVEALVVGYLVVEAVLGFTILMKASRQFRESLGGSWWQAWPSLHNIGKLLQDSWRLLFYGSLADTLKLLTARVDIFILGWLRPPGEVAMLQAAKNFLDRADRITYPIAIVAFSDLAKLAANKDVAGLIGLLKRTGMLGALAALSIALTLFLGAEPLVHLLYGAEFADTVDLLRILAWTPVWYVALALQPTFASINKMKWSIECFILAIIPKVILLVWLVPSMGAMGVAISNLIYCCVYLVLFPWYVKRIQYAACEEACTAQPAVAEAKRCAHGADCPKT